jgi:flagellar hook-length control protein FliK
MDILATLVPAVPVAPSAPAEAPAAPSAAFAAVLSQVTAAVAEPVPALPVVQPEGAPVLPQVAAVAEPVEVPAPVVVQPLAVAEPQPPMVDDVLNLMPDAPVAQAEAAEPSTEADTTLDDIRQRMALIENAGEPDTAAVIVIPSIALSVPVPVPVSVTPTAPVVTSSAPVHTQSLSQSLSATDDDTDTPDPVDLPDAMPALVASVADTVPTVRAHTEERQPDSQPDPQTLVSFAPSAFSPTSVAANDAVTRTGLVLSAAIGSTDWAADLGQQMVDMVTRGDQQVDLRLHPAELGPLSISLNLNDGSTQAQFQAAHASVRAAVEQALPQLREALATQGIALGQASVSDQSSRQAAGGQAQRDPQANPGTTTASSIEVAPAPVQQMVLSGSGVDLYV